MSVSPLLKNFFNNLDFFLFISPHRQIVYHPSNDSNYNMENRFCWFQLYKTIEDDSEIFVINFFISSRTLDKKLKDALFQEFRTRFSNKILKLEHDNIIIKYERDEFIPNNYNNNGYLGFRIRLKETNRINNKINFFDNLFEKTIINEMFGVVLDFCKRKIDEKNTSVEIQKNKISFPFSFPFNIEMNIPSRILEYLFLPFDIFYDKYNKNMFNSKFIQTLSEKKQLSILDISNPNLRQNAQDKADFDLFYSKIQKVYGKKLTQKDEYDLKEIIFLQLKIHDFFILMTSLNAYYEITSSSTEPFAFLRTQTRQFGLDDSVTIQEFSKSKLIIPGFTSWSTNKYMLSMLSNITEINNTYIDFRKFINIRLDMSSMFLENNNGFLIGGGGDDHASFFRYDEIEHQLVIDNLLKLGKTSQPLAKFTNTVNSLPYYTKLNLLQPQDHKLFIPFGAQIELID